MRPLGKTRSVDFGGLLEWDTLTAEGPRIVGEARRLMPALWRTFPQCSQPRRLLLSATVLEALARAAGDKVYILRALEAKVDALISQARVADDWRIAEANASLFQEEVLLADGDRSLLISAKLYRIEALIGRRAFHGVVDDLRCVQRDLEGLLEHTEQLEIGADVLALRVARIYLLLDETQEPTNISAYRRFS